MVRIARTGFLTVVLFTLLGASGMASAQRIWASCKPLETVVLPERIAVRCATAVDGRFLYFAASTMDAKATARGLSIMEAAQLGDKWVNVLFDVNDVTMGVAFGCMAADCRPFLALSLAEGPLPEPDNCVFGNRPGCPGYCSTHANDKTNCLKEYCAVHPDVQTCPGFCTTHPDDNYCSVCKDVSNRNNPKCQ